MFDSIIATINGWIASGVASWNNVVSQIQKAIDDADGAYENHSSIREESVAAGFGVEWVDIESRLRFKLGELKLLARGINAVLPGETITGLGFVFPPIIAGLTVGGALFLIGGLYVIVSESFDFFLKVTGKIPSATSGRVDTLVKYGIVAAAVVLLLPKLIGSKT